MCNVKYKMLNLSYKDFAACLAWWPSVCRLRLTKHIPQLHIQLTLQTPPPLLQRTTLGSHTCCITELYSTCDITSTPRLRKSSVYPRMTATNSLLPAPACCCVSASCSRDICCFKDTCEMSPTDNNWVMSLSRYRHCQKTHCQKTHRSMISPANSEHLTGLPVDIWEWRHHHLDCTRENC